MVKWQLLPLLLCITAMQADISDSLLNLEYDLIVLRQALGLESDQFKPGGPKVPLQPVPPSEKIEVGDCPAVIVDNSYFINKLSNNYTSSFGIPNNYLYPQWVALNNSFIVPTTDLYKSISKTAADRLAITPAKAEAATKIIQAFEASAKKSVNQPLDVTKINELEKSIWQLIEVNPYQAPRLLKQVAATNLFAPSAIFNKISLEVAASYINSAVQELDNEIMLQSSNANAFKEELAKKINPNAANKKSARTESLKKLAEAIFESVMYVDRLIEIYNDQANNTAISSFDKDLFASNIFCLWCTTRDMYETITGRFGPGDQQLILNFDGAPDKAENKKIKLQEYFKEVYAKIEQLKGRYPQGEPKVLGILAQLANQIKSGTKSQALDIFIANYIPVLREPKNLRALQALVRCNYMLFSDDKTKGDLISILQQIRGYAGANKLPQAASFEKLMELIEGYSVKRKNDIEIAKLFEALDVDPRAYKDTTIIDDLIDKLDKTKPLAGMTKAEENEFLKKKKEALGALNKTKETIVIGSAMGEQLGKFFTQVCRSGVQQIIDADIQREIYDSQQYTKADTSEQPLILQSIVAYLFDRFYDQSEYLIRTGEHYKSPGCPIKCDFCAFKALMSVLAKLFEISTPQKPWLLDLDKYQRNYRDFDSRSFMADLGKYFKKPQG